jgi:hypothetical protein
MRPFLPMLLLLMVFSYPLAGCKKKGETGTDAALEADAESSSDDADKAGEKRKGKKSRKKGKKKGKKKDKKGKKKESEVKSTEESIEAKPEVVKLAHGKTRRVKEEKAELATAGVKVPADVEPAVARAARPSNGVEPSPNHRSVTPPPVTVAVARLLTVIDVNRLLQEKGWIAYGPVQGIPPSEYFNSLIYRKPGTNRFVTILVWDFPQYAQALEKWNEMAATYPNTQVLEKKFTKSVFYSYRNQVSTLTALHDGESTVLSISCHNEICDDTALYEMAKTAFGRVH